MRADGLPLPSAFALQIAMMIAVRHVLRTIGVTLALSLKAEKGGRGRPIPAIRLTGDEKRAPFPDGSKDPSPAARRLVIDECRRDAHLGYRPSDRRAGKGHRLASASTPRGVGSSIENSLIFPEF